jgi:hypothetical protein
MPVILATQETEVQKSAVRSHPSQIVLETLSQKTLHKSRAGRVGLRWKALSSSPSTAKKNKKQKQKKKPKTVLLPDMIVHF